jgi:hypothetical protein
MSRPGTTAVITLAGLLLLGGVRTGIAGAPAEPQEGLFAPHSWSRTDVYQPPEFPRFFPDDPEGGKALDALWGAADHDQRPTAEVLRAARQGLRHTQQPEEIVRWIGGRHIWGRVPQNGDAIEILYHAVGFPGDSAAASKTRHYCVYFGLSVVQPKPPAVLHTLVDLCMQRDDYNDFNRIVWGTRSQRDELIPYLKPYLEAENPATREEAAVFEKILKGTLDDSALSAHRARERARARYTERLPEMDRVLRQGNASERKDLLRLIARERLYLIMDDSFVASFAACAEERDPEVRRAAAEIVGYRWFWNRGSPNDAATALELRLARDPDREVRYKAVYFGLSLARPKSEEVIRQLLEIAFGDRERRMYGRIWWCLRSDRQALVATTEILNRYLRGSDGAQARMAREVYRDMTGANPPHWRGLAVSLSRRANHEAEGGPAPAEVDPAQVPAVAPDGLFAPYAWRRTDTYMPPEFQRFFPDDGESGQKLDALWQAKDRNERPDAEVLSMVRQGLRRATVDLAKLLRWLGERFIAGKSPPNADAVEIFYHGLDLRYPEPGFDRIRHNVVYFGLSLVRPMTPAIRLALVDLAMISEEPAELDRIAWAAKAERAEILAYLKPYASAGDQTTRGKAAVVARILSGELDAFAWATERTRLRTQVRFAERLPEIKKVLEAGNARERGDTLRLIIREQVALIMDDSFVAAFEACVRDPDIEIRRDVAAIVGDRWIWYPEAPSPEAVALVLRLASEDDYTVQHNAVYYGLARIHGAKSEDLVRALVAYALAQEEPDLRKVIAQALEPDRDTAARILDAELRRSDPARARAAAAIYHDMTGRNPPGSSGRPDQGATHRGGSIRGRFAS